MNMGAVRLFLRRSVMKLEQFRYPVYAINKRKPPTNGNTMYRSFCSSTKPIGEFVDSCYSPETDEFERESPYGNVNFSEITSDPEEIKVLKVLQLEIDSLYQQGQDVPRDLNQNHWSELLALSSRNQRMKYLRYLRLNEIKRYNMKKEKAEARKKFEDKKTFERKEIELTTNSPLEYSLKYNTLFFRLNPSRMHRFYHSKIFNAMRFGAHIVLDCSYEPFMSRIDISHCVRQINFMWIYNREQPNPFHIMFCNMDPDGVMLKKLRRGIPQLDDPDSPFYYSRKGYLDFYPKERLVYLTPDADQELLKYNPNDIYIIGGFVDMARSEALSFAKAKKEGLRMAKFPLDKYLHWNLGVKSLTLNQSIAIMNDMKDKNDWKFAFRHVPQRKIQGARGELRDADRENRSNEISARVIREQFRRNVVYDLIENDRLKKLSDQKI